jgi:hypothetical protein
MYGKRELTLKVQLEGVTVEGKPKRVMNNTVLYTSGGKEFLRYHMTDIVTKDLATGVLTLNSGGYRTITTKERFNAFLPAFVTVWQDEGIWRLRCNVNLYGKKQDILFFDRMQITKDGIFIGETPSEYDIKIMRKQKREIRKFSSDYIRRWGEGKVPAPSNGDCFYCQMVRVDNGEMVGGTDHLKAHMREHYYVPSLLLRAVKQFPVCQWAMGALGNWVHGETPSIHPNLDGICSAQLEKSLRRFLYRQFGFAT